jgi:hypothetical protein
MPSLCEPAQVAFYSAYPVPYFAHSWRYWSASDSALEIRCSCAASRASRAATRLKVVAAHPTIAN